MIGLLSLRSVSQARLAGFSPETRRVLAAMESGCRYGAYPKSGLPPATAANTNAAIVTIDPNRTVLMLNLMQFSSLR
jgi:hypothetical protein